MGTREALFGIQVLGQNCKKYGKTQSFDLQIYGLRKTFDRILQDKLLNILQTTEIDEKEVNIGIKLIYSGALTDEDIGIKVNGPIINNIQCADDTTLLTEKLETLQHLTNNGFSKELGLYTNTKKIKFMPVIQISKSMVT